MDFPNVPFALGVPNVGRIPPAAISLVRGGLSRVAGIMDTTFNSVADHPTAQLSTLAGPVGDAQGIMSSVTGAVTTYASSTLFAPFVQPVAQMNSSLGALSSTIGSNPTDPVSSVENDVEDTANLADDTSASFDAAADAETTDPAIETSESITVTADPNAPQWGIFKDGSSVLDVSGNGNVASFEYKKDWSIPDYPVEGGGFQSYNKVELPYDVRMRFSKGGSVEKRTDFLKQVEAIDGTLDLYDAVTPEKTYLKCNVVHVDYRRQANNGMGLIIVDIYLEEVRDTATASFAQAASSPATSSGASPASPTATKAPSAQAAKSGGTVQPKVSDYDASLLLGLGAGG